MNDVLAAIRQALPTGETYCDRQGCVDGLHACECLDTAAEILRALATAGYAVVPKSPSDAMLAAARACVNKSPNVSRFEQHASPRDYWRAMVNAGCQ